MLLHSEMRALHACLHGYFRERLVGKPSWQIFPDFINELCRGPRGTKGQKILSMNRRRSGAEERRGAVIKKVGGHINVTDSSWSIICTVYLFHNKQSGTAHSGPRPLVDGLLMLAFVGWHMTLCGRKWWESNVVVAQWHPLWRNRDSVLCHLCWATI